MTGWCPHKTGTLEEQECHFDGYCSECPHNKRDLISRRAAIQEFKDLPDLQNGYSDTYDKARIISVLEGLPPAQSEQRWVLCSERLPENNEPVNITWVNRDPPSYYSNIKDIPFTATGHYHNGKWWWFSSTCKDYLDEYGESDIDIVADGVEVVAWQPLPEPYKEK